MLIVDVAPTVVGSHMSLLRPTTPRLTADRRNGKPGEVKNGESLSLLYMLKTIADLRSLWN